MTNTMTLQDWLDGFAEDRPDAATLCVFSDWCEDEGMLDWAASMRWMADHERWPWRNRGNGRWRFWQKDDWDKDDGDLLGDVWFGEVVPNWDTRLLTCLQWLVHQHSRLSHESPKLLESKLHASSD